jgi:hypothetical protein
MEITVIMAIIIGWIVTIGGLLMVYFSAMDRKAGNRNN